MHTTISSLARRGTVLTASAVLVCAVAGCGGSADSTNAAAAPTSAANGRQGGQRVDPATQQKITQCLQAAGLPVPSFGARPSRAPGETPPATPPTRQPGQNGGGAFGNPQVRAALQACGITLPTRPPGAGNGGGNGNGGAAGT